MKTDLFQSCGHYWVCWHIECSTFIASSFRCDQPIFIVGICIPVVVQSPSCVLLFATPWTAAHQAFHPSPSPKACPSSYSLHRWCHPAISPSDALFSFCLQFFPASGTFPMSQLFSPDDQSTGASASASVLPTSMQGWVPSRFTGLTSLVSKGLSRVFSTTIVWRHQCFGTPPSLRSRSYNHMYHWEDHSLDYTDLCWVCYLTPRLIIYRLGSQLIQWTFNNTWINGHLVSA